MRHHVCCRSASWQSALSLAEGCTVQTFRFKLMKNGFGDVFTLIKVSIKWLKNAGKKERKAAILNEILQDIGLSGWLPNICVSIWKIELVVKHLEDLEQCFLTDWCSVRFSGNKIGVFMGRCRLSVWQASWIPGVMTWILHLDMFHYLLRLVIHRV